MVRRIAGMTAGAGLATLAGSVVAGTAVAGAQASTSSLSRTSRAPLRCLAAVSRTRAATRASEWSPWSCNTEADRTAFIRQEQKACRGPCRPAAGRRLLAPSQ
jgi:hypothetical protein